MNDRRAVSNRQADRFPSGHCKPHCLALKRWQVHRKACFGFFANFKCLSLRLKLRHSIFDFHALASGQNGDAIAVVLAEQVLRAVGMSQFKEHAFAGLLI